MNRLPQTWVLILLLLASANDKIVGEEADAEKKIASIRKILEETRINTTGFPEEMPLSKFLVAVRRQLPGEKKIALRLEETELGKDACRLTDAPVRCSGKQWPLSSILRRAMRQVTADEELDYAVRADGIVITRAPLAVHSRVYHVGNLVPEMPSLLARRKEHESDLFEGVNSSDGMAVLVRYLMYPSPLRSWEKIEILNGTRLAVFASTYNQEGIADTLAALRCLANAAVVMNARLYEVDRDFFVKHIASLFAKANEAKERPTLVAIDDALLKKLLQHKPLLESEDTKLRPNVKRAFLSRHSVFRYAAGRNAAGEKGTGTGLEGVSFEVQPIVRSDRRFLRLHIAQHVAQLVGIDKSKKLDVTTGKDVEIETPNVCKSSVTGTIRIPDTGALLMPVSYRPPGKDGDNRVWLLVARPFIWIEAEEKERGPGNETSSKEIWKSGIPKEEKEEAPAANRR